MQGFVNNYIKHPGNFSDLCWYKAEQKLDSYIDYDIQTNRDENIYLSISGIDFRVFNFLAYFIFYLLQKLLIANRNYN